MHLFDKQVFLASLKHAPKILMWSTLWGGVGVFNQYSKRGMYAGMVADFLLLTIQFGLFFIVVGAIIDQVIGYIKRRKSS